MSKAELSVGDSIEVTIERLAYGGEAVAHHHRLAIFVQEAAPEDRLRVRIIERKKRFARAVIEEIITPSPSRRKPPCRYFGQCGGCQLQHINYETQLTAKVGFIRDALQRTGQINWSDEIKIHAAEEFQYRLRAKIKLERVFADDETSAAQRQTAKGLRIGFYQARSHTVCDVEYCEILLPELNELLQTIRNTYTTAHINEIEIASSQIFDSEPEDLNHINLKDTGSHSYATFAETIGRQIARAEYRFAPSIFFQANALLLDEFVKEAVGSEKGDFAVDLYAGVGLFTIQLARNFKRVIGVESNPRAVEFASGNISINKSENAEVVLGRTDDWLKNFLSQPVRQTPDLLLLDPPRSGAAEAIELIGKLNPQRIHYVSCDPVTLARDLKQLVASNYEIERIVAFDMFPQTYHVETIAFLTRR